MDTMLAEIQWGPVSAAIQIAMTVVVGAFGFLIRRTISEMDRRQKESNDRIEYLEKHVVLKEYCERGQNVSQEDWLRESGKLSRQQERLIGEIQQLRGEMANGAQIGAAIAGFLTARKDTKTDGEA